MVLLSGRVSGGGNFLQLLGALLIFAFVLVITYYTTRWIANYQKQQNLQRNLKVIETMKLTTNKYIQIIEVGEVYLVIGVGKDEITMLAQLDREQLNDVELSEYGNRNHTGESFQKILSQLKDRLPKK